MSAQQGSRKNAVVNSVFIIAFFVILCKLVSVAKRVAEAEVMASSPDAERGDHRRFASLSALLLFLANIDSVCLGIIICRFLGNSFRKLFLGYVPFWNFMVYRTYFPLRALFLVYLSNRCSSSDGSYACPMSYSWEYLEAFHLLPEQYVGDLIFISALQTSFILSVVLVSVVGDYFATRHVVPAAGDASYEAVNTSDKNEVLYEA